jgi:hypothetical protein
MRARERGEGGRATEICCWSSRDSGRRPGTGGIFMWRGRAPRRRRAQAAGDERPSRGAPRAFWPRVARDRGQKLGGFGWWRALVAWLCLPGWLATRVVAVARPPVSVPEESVPPRGDTPGRVEPSPSRPTVTFGFDAPPPPPLRPVRGLFPLARSRFLSPPSLSNHNDRRLEACRLVL